jgi:magnesium transporter
MQRLFHVAASAAEAVEIDPSELSRVRGDGWVWLDVVWSDSAEVVAVGRQFGFDRYALEEVIRETKYARVEPFGDHTFVTGHAISMVPDSLEVIEFDAFIGPDYLVTFAQQDLAGIAWGQDHVMTAGAVADTGPDRVFARIAEASALRFHPLLDVLEHRIIDLEDRAIDAHPEVPIEVQALRRDVLTLRTATAPQRDAFRLLDREDLPAIGERSRLRFGAVFDHYSRITEELDSARSLLAGVLDTYRGAVAEKANEVMKVLTVFAAIVLPLSLMAGIYGMNFSHMPELAWRWGYFGLLGLMALVGLGLWIYFSRRGFIGGPKLNAIPRGVGRGLAGIASLTVVPTLRLLGITRKDNGS